MQDFKIKIGPFKAKHDDSSDDDDDSGGGGGGGGGVDDDNDNDDNSSDETNNYVRFLAESQIIATIFMQQLSSYSTKN